MLILLKKFHALCMERGIKYSVHAGTMIGIVREHGFIPWDDDADLSFTREEYEKFAEVMRTEELKKVLADPRVPDEDLVQYRFGTEENAFPQLWMSRPGKPSVWLDFFIYDYITENRVGQKVKLAEIAMLLGILKTKETMALTKKRGLYKGFKYAAIYCGYLIGKLIPKEKKFRLAEKIRMGHHGSRKLVHRANDRFVGAVLILPADILSQCVNMPFEDTELMVTKRYDEVLKSSYGPDYMTPKKDATAQSKVHSENRELRG